jgi:hypothetical protein
VGDLIAKASPATLFETILSAHTVPHRFVQHIWTQRPPPTHFFNGGGLISSVSMSLPPS